MAFANTGTAGSLAVKLWRGERMCLVGMDVTNPEDDFVGFAIEVKSPGSPDYIPLRNRLNFDYNTPGQTVDGFRNFLSTSAPFQKFRWMHFPYDPKDGTYLYRVTKIHMNAAGALRNGDQVADIPISLDRMTYSDYLDIGFTRNFASSQAYADKFGNNSKVIPSDPDQGLTFNKLSDDIYQWLGFEAYDLIFGLLNEVVNDPTLSIDVFAYDFNERDIVAKLESCGTRVRAIIDDSGSHKPATSAESQAAARLAASAGAGAVKRMHFKTLQHNKVFIIRRDGQPIKVLFGSTNFSYRGLYIQANNALVFHSADAAGLFGRAFELAFQGLDAFKQDGLSGKWNLVQAPGMPAAHFCFSPHASSNLSLSPVGAAIDQASSSVFYAIAFLSQIRSGPVRQAVDRLMGKDVFSYGISDKEGGLEIRKPDGTVGLVDFSYLANHAPEPFKTEWSGGSGIHTRQIRRDRLQPTDGQGVHRLVQPVAQRRDGQRRQSRDDRRPAGCDVLCARGAAHIRSSAFPRGYADGDGTDKSDARKATRGRTEAVVRPLL
ncbi:hypothetical protein HGP17_15055 [Rhizobium sp. P38BS-XIX]|uniref:phospholipase D-like domain-containing protein n=1 Tax=Rhizobium sp. P38BS-XIX TaxID=2726740 RepID=UPI001456D122|nr:phospholipase D-like domain-containing protein [Rhizobium sp. P38BS-XIX]NLR98131.1 hypothetical protein [Rhizobium sp. P38BS-XIX]